MSALGTAGILPARNFYILMNVKSVLLVFFLFVSTCVYGGSILGVAPNYGTPGESLTVRIVAFDVPQNLDASKISFGAGITVASIEERIDEDRKNLNLSFIRVRILIDPFVNPVSRKVAIKGIATDSRATYYISSKGSPLAFSQLFELPSGYYPGSFAKLVTARLNRDKLSELLQINTTEQSNHGIISIVPSESNRLQKKIRRLAVQMSAMALAPGDFNNDGFTDIAVIGWASSDHAAGGMTILLGDGKGNLKRTGIRDACDGPLSIAAGDIDRDGNLDLAVSGLLDSVCLYYGDGKLGFTESRINMQPFTASFTDVTITSVDGDQLPDLLVADQSGNVIFIIGTKEGGSTLVPVVGHKTTPPFTIVAGDLDRNGISDIPTTVGFGSVINLSCCGRNGFYNNQRIHVSADYLHLADMNQDGDLDLITTSSITDILTISLGKAGSEFDDAIQFEIGEVPIAVSSGDWDNDGKMDLVYF